MTYDIYFHNDFDGRASAAVVLAFLRSRGDNIAHYVPVDFYLLPQWTHEKFFELHKLFKGKRYPAIVVDFPYHPAAAWWFDHHETPFRKPGWEKRFVPDARHMVAPDYPSCCHAVYDSLKKNFGWRAPQHFRSLVKWLDVIDGAQYATPRETIYLNKPALCVDAFIDATYHSRVTAAWMIKLLAERSLVNIARLPEVKKIADATRAKNIAALPFYSAHIIVRGNTAYLDLTAARTPVLRHSSYYLFPKISYAIRFVKKGSLYHVGVGWNPWKKSRKNSFHIGKFLKRFGGGGHAKVGAVDFRTKAEALKAIDIIVKRLNREP